VRSLHYVPTTTRRKSEPQGWNADQSLGLGGRMIRGFSNNAGTAWRRFLTGVAVLLLEEKEELVCGQKGDIKVVSIVDVVE